MALASFDRTRNTHYSWNLFQCCRRVHSTIINISTSHGHCPNLKKVSRQILEYTVTVLDADRNFHNLVSTCFEIRQTRTCNTQNEMLQRFKQNYADILALRPHCTHLVFCGTHWLQPLDVAFMFHLSIYCGKTVPSKASSKSWKSGNNSRSRETTERFTWKRPIHRLLFQASGDPTWKIKTKCLLQR